MQNDFFDHPNCIGWTREGVEEVPDSGCAVVLSNGDAGNKKMYIGKQHAGKLFIDALKNCDQQIEIDEMGEAEFYCPAGSLSVWVNKEILSKLEI